LGSFPTSEFFSVTSPGPRPLGALVLGLALTVAGQGTLFRSTTRTVAAYVAIRDSRHRIVSDLSRDDFAVSVDGQPVALSVFDTGVQPLTLVFLLDTGKFSWTNLALALRLANVAVNHLAQSDRMAIGSFGIEGALSPRFTADQTVLRRTLDEEVWPTDSPGFAAPTLFRALDRIGREPGLRVIIPVGLFGYGCPLELRQFCPSASDLRREFLRRDVVLTHLVPWPPLSQDRDGTLLQQPDAVMPDDVVSLPQDTGGSLLRVAATDNFDDVVVGVLDDLRHRYLLGFDVPSDDGHEHQIRVRVDRPNVEVHARRSFVAGP
jgi:hypothetical protein